MSKEIKSEEISVANLPINIIDGATYIIAQQNPNTFSHMFFKYPCRFIPEIPRWGMRKYLNDNGDANVFDPFSGSGTTLLEGLIGNYHSFGTEIDEIARLLIKVKTTKLSQEELVYTEKYFNIILQKINTENIEISKPHINNLEHWFSLEAIEILGKLLTLINEAENKKTRDFLKICFISIIKKVSFADDMSPKPYVSSKIKKEPPNALEEFKLVFKKYFIAISELSKLPFENKAIILNGDALNFQTEVLFDIAITSPPYINAFDYARVMRLENLWLGVLTEDELRKKKRKYVGTEQLSTANEELDLEILDESLLLNEYYQKIYCIDKKRALIVKKFFSDMKVNIKSIYDNLKNDGCYMIVIGNSTIRGIEIESWKVLLDIAQNIGFEKDVHFSYVIQNPYIRIPRGKKGGKINFDQVLVLRKVDSYGTKR